MATIKGKWKWNSEIDYFEMSRVTEGVNISFISNNTAYTRITAYYSTGWGTLEYSNADGEIGVGTNKGAEDPVIIAEAYRIIDFGSEKQEIPDEVYNFIKSNAILLAPDIAFMANVTVDHDLSVLGTLSINSGITGISAKDVGTYSTKEIDEKFLADYKVGDEKAYSIQTTDQFYIQNNFKETVRDGFLTEDYKYIQTSWPSIRYDYSTLEPKSLILGEGGEGLPDGEGMYYANRSELTHTKNALDIFHTSFDVDGGVQLKLTHNKILGERTDEIGNVADCLFTATADVFEAPSFKTSGTITIGETTINEELLKKLLASANIESLTNSYGEVQF